MTQSPADKLNQDVQELVTEVADNLKAAAQKTGKEANQVIEEVRAHPVTTAALVASAAALLGVLVARLNAED